MPEGPQVRRVGNLIARFKGADVTEVNGPPSRKPWDIVLPVPITRVEVVGKNIFVSLGSGGILYNHMLMWGSWRKGCEPYGKKRLNTCFITTKGTLGYYGGGILKIISAEGAAVIKQALGPDVMQTSTAGDAFARVATSKLAVGEALLSQNLVAGIGNIYKSEGLFAARINPVQRADRVSAEAYAKLFDFLNRQMHQDVRRSGPISTTPLALRKKGTRNFVYRRYHQPCLFCGTRVERIYQGASPRSTYYCPKCQPA